MKIRFSTTLAAMVFLISSSMSSAANWPKRWIEALPTGTYLMLEPQIEGNQQIVDQKDLPAILKALKGDSQKAIQKRYPKAKFVLDDKQPNLIKVTPVLAVPDMLLPWSQLKVKLNFQLASGHRARVEQVLNVMRLADQGPEAANYAFQKVVSKLP